MKIEIIDSDKLDLFDLHSCIYYTTLIGMVNYTNLMFKGKTIRVTGSDDDLPENILINYDHKDDKKGGIVFLSNIPSDLISREIKKCLLDMVKNYVESVKSSTTTV